MSLEKKIFEEFFSKQIDKETFIAKLGMNEKDFHIRLCEELEKNLTQQDSIMAEYLIHALSIWVWKMNNIENRPVDYFLKVLNKLVLHDWHKQHEDIVDILQLISDESSVEPLYQTIYLKLQYLEWDDNYSLQKRCTRAIASIGGEKAIAYLELLKQEDNVIIRELAQRKWEHYSYGD